QRVKPEDRLHDRMDARCKVIPAAHVAEFMSQNCPKLCWCETLYDPFGKQQHWAEYAENARLHPRPRGPHWDRALDVRPARRAQYGANMPPPLPPPNEEKKAPTEPNAGRERR